MRLFVAEYLELDLSMHSSSKKREPHNEEDGWGDDSWLREERRKRQRERERDELVS